MAVRIDATGDSLARTASLPALTNFTWCGWAYIVSSVSAAMFGFSNAASDNAIVFLTFGPAGVLQIGSYNAGTTFATNFGSRPADGTWAFIYVRCSSTSGLALQAGWAAREGTFVQVSETLINGTAPLKMYIGNDMFGQNANARFAACKVWDAVLTDDELYAERSTVRPQRFANLHLWAPMIATAVADNYIDYSGNGKSLTAAGTLTVEDGPPVSWGAQVLTVPGSLSGTTYNVSLSITSTPAPALVRQGGKVLSIASTSVPRIVRAVGKVRSITSTPVPVIARQLARALSITSTSIPRIIRQLGRTLSIVSTPVPSLSTARSFLKILSIAATPVAAISRASGKTIAIASTSVPLIVKALARTFSIISTPAPSLSALKVFLKSLSITSAPVPGIVRSVGKALTIVSTLVPLTGRGFTKTVSITATPVPLVTKQQSKVLNAVATGVASLVATFVAAALGLRGRVISVIATVTGRSGQTVVSVTGKTIGRTIRLTGTDSETELP